MLIIKNVINCHNEFKEPSEKYIVSESDLDKVHMKPTDYFEYDTYFRTDIIDSKKLDGIQKCIRLSQDVSLIHNKFPFSYLMLDENNNLKVVNKNIYEDEFPKKIIKII